MTTGISSEMAVRGIVVDATGVITWACAVEVVFFFGIQLMVWGLPQLWLLGSKSRELHRVREARDLFALIAIDVGELNPVDFPVATRGKT